MKSKNFIYYFGEMEKRFNPLIFLASLGAGWIAIIPFALMQYSVNFGEWLIKISHIMEMFGWTNTMWLYYILFAIMIVFGLLHIVLTAIFLKQLFARYGSKENKEYKEDPLKNYGLITPLLSLLMTMNLVIWPIRFFIPNFADNLQTFMLPALIFWILLFMITMYASMKILKRAFEQNFDIEKINFGWLLTPFTIWMLSVVGAWIAAMSKDSQIANTAAFFTLISASMWILLFLVKLITLFKKHFEDKNWLPSKYFMPSFLIVIPNITLYAITFFRLWHYLEKTMWFHLDYYFYFVIVGGFAFATWYLIFGLMLMKKFFQNHFFKREYYVQLRGLICPFVAYAVLWSFAYKVMWNNIVIYRVILWSTLISIILYWIIFRRYISCGKKWVVCE